MTINVLFIGDVVGRPGRRLVRDLLPSLVAKYEVDLVVANGENAAGGLGLTIKAAEELFNYGVDVLTSGNHIFRHKELYDYFDSQPYLIRPANYPESAPGRGWVLARTKGGDPVGIINVMGRTFMEPLDCPFRKAKEAIADLAEDGVKMMLVDIHAEATSEKKALGWYLDGHVGRSNRYAHACPDRGCGDFAEWDRIFDGCGYDRRPGQRHRHEAGGGDSAVRDRASDSF
jgi:metallophosphoesterase (TIGR00282 family)